jgi:DNA-binding transcriptional LysR family regulator
MASSDATSSATPTAFRDTPRMPLAHAASLEGAGIATLPTFLCSDDLAVGRLVAVLDGWTMAPMRVYAVFPSARQVSPAVRAFVDLLAAHFASGDMAAK